MQATVREFDCVESFLATNDGQPGLLVCDVGMPGMTAIDLQLALVKYDAFLPFVLVTEFCDTRFVVDAIRNGATTVIKKPFSDEELLIAVHEAITDYRSGIESYHVIREARLGLAKLTDSERSVVQLIKQGCSHKEIALELDISARTALLRRKSIFKKMNVAHVLDLFRLIVLVEMADANRSRVLNLGKVSAGFGR